MDKIDSGHKVAKHLNQLNRLVKKFLPKAEIINQIKKHIPNFRKRTQTDLIEQLIFPDLATHSAILGPFYRQLTKRIPDIRKHFTLPLIKAMARASQLAGHVKKNGFDISALQEAFKAEQDAYKALKHQRDALEGVDANLPAFNDSQFIAELKYLGNLHESMATMQKGAEGAHDQIYQLRDEQRDLVTAHIKYLRKVHAELLQYLERCRHLKNKNKPAAVNPARLADKIMLHFIHEFLERLFKNNHKKKNYHANHDYSDFIIAFNDFIDEHYHDVVHCVPWHDFFTELSDTIIQFQGNYLRIDNELNKAIQLCDKKNIRLDEAIQSAQQSTQACRNILDHQHDLLQQWHKGLGPLPELPRPGYSRGGPGPRPD